MSYVFSRIIKHIRNTLVPNNLLCPLFINVHLSAQTFPAKWSLLFQFIVPGKCLVFPEVNILIYKHTVCLSAKRRPQAFYGAVIQAWPGNSCGAPSLSLSPARALNLGKCHRFVNVLFHCCWACCSVVCSFYWGSVSGQCRDIAEIKSMLHVM